MYQLYFYQLAKGTDIEIRLNDISPALLPDSDRLLEVRVALLSPGFSSAVAESEKICSGSQ